MRRIEKRTEPRELSEWRARHSSDPNFGYSLLSGKAAHEVAKDSLIEEQGWLCAYTGQSIRRETAHIEHLKPQAHCNPAERIDYRNMVACFPGPNAASPGYGAIEKGDWPAPEAAHLFVSPLRPGCEQRFRFDSLGRIRPASNDDAAAAETIRRLGLDHRSLIQNRAADFEFIDSLGPKQFRSRLAQLESEAGHLTQFCFALKQVLAKRIQILAAIRQQKLL